LKELNQRWKERPLCRL